MAGVTFSSPPPSLHHPTHNCPTNQFFWGLTPPPSTRLPPLLITPRYLFPPFFFSQMMEIERLRAIEAQEAQEAAVRRMREHGAEQIRHQVLHMRAKVCVYACVVAAKAEESHLSSSEYPQAQAHTQLHAQTQSHHALCLTTFLSRPLALQRFSCKSASSSG